VSLAYAEARPREREAKSNAEAQNWSRVALAIAHKTCRRIGFDTASRMAADANFASSLATCTQSIRANSLRDRLVAKFALNVMWRHVNF
jgi:hypothetical protein